jgi:hypothetical protein
VTAGIFASAIDASNVNAASTINGSIRERIGRNAGEAEKRMQAAAIDNTVRYDECPSSVAL